MKLEFAFAVHSDKEELSKFNSPATKLRHDVAQMHSAALKWQLLTEKQRLVCVALPVHALTQTRTF